MAGMLSWLVSEQRLFHCVEVTGLEWMRQAAFFLGGKVARLSPSKVGLGAGMRMGPCIPSSSKVYGHLTSTLISKASNILVSSSEGNSSQRLCM